LSRHEGASQTISISPQWNQLKRQISAVRTVCTHFLASNAVPIVTPVELETSERSAAS
jgi:hypothetical protein